MLNYLVAKIISLCFNMVNTMYTLCPCVALITCILPLFACTKNMVNFLVAKRLTSFAKRDRILLHAFQRYVETQQVILVAMKNA